MNHSALMMIIAAPHVKNNPIKTDILPNAMKIFGNLSSVTPHTTTGWVAFFLPTAFMTNGSSARTITGTNQLEFIYWYHPTNSLFRFGISSLLKGTLSSSSFNFKTRASASGTTSLQRVRKLPGFALLIA